MKNKLINVLSSIATLTIFSICWLLFIIQFAEYVSGPAVPSAFISKRELLNPSSFNPKNQEPHAQANRVALDSLSWRIQ